MNLQAFGPGRFNYAALRRFKDRTVCQVPKGNSVVIYLALRQNPVGRGLNIAHAPKEPAHQIERMHARIENDALILNTADPARRALNARHLAPRDIGADKADIAS